MEDMLILSPTDELQLYALHYVFLPRNNRLLIEFKNTWNNHHLLGLNLVCHLISFGYRVCLNVTLTVI